MSHLHSAAAALERVLAAKWPEYVWTVEVLEREAAQALGASGPTIRQVQPGAAGDHPDPVGDGHDPATAGFGDDDSLKQAA